MGGGGGGGGGLCNWDILFMMFGRSLPKILYTVVQRGREGGKEKGVGLL